MLAAISKLCMEKIFVTLILTSCLFQANAQQKKDFCERSDLTIKSTVFEATGTSINAEILPKGFRLIMNDTSYKIVGFCVTWDAGIGKYTAKLSPAV